MSEFRNRAIAVEIDTTLPADFQIKGYQLSDGFQNLTREEQLALSASHLSAVLRGQTPLCKADRDTLLSR